MIRKLFEEKKRNFNSPSLSSCNTRSISFYIKSEKKSKIMTEKIIEDLREWINEYHLDLYEYLMFELISLKLNDVVEMLSNIYIRRILYVC